MTILQFIKKQISLKDFQIENTVKLINEKATLPFIARYRKEMTGGLEEEQLEKIINLKENFETILKRQEFILKTIKEKNKLDPKLEQKIKECFDINELEDIYLPYKEKRKTKASKAKSLGLEPLAEMILEQDDFLELEYEADNFVYDEVPTMEDALQGARDIIAEKINEDKEVRNIIRSRYYTDTIIKSKVVAKKKGEAEKYKDYFNFEENLFKCASHRVLAILRGSKEGFLNIGIENIRKKNIITEVENMYLDTDNKFVEKQISLAIKDSFKRLIHPSLETEFISKIRETAEDKSIEFFKKNLEQLLLSPPLGKKNILAIDPGYRTGCKIVCLDNQGNLKKNDVIYPHQPQNEQEKSKNKILELIKKYNIEAIAIGDGAASREIENFIKQLSLENIKIFVVSEDGASIYSASKVAKEEFPKHDITVRGAVSIGRRLMNPLSELVKIEPKSLGVGQYQHDINQTKLKKTLDFTVEKCVNKIGVDINTASYHILKYISGIGETLAKSIVEHKKQNGEFVSRNEFLKIPKFGKKVFEQSAGFLRINNGENPLDNSSVHPERYSLIENMAKDINIPVKEIIGNEESIKKIDINNYVSEDIGIPTLEDIIKELKKPAQDPREELKGFEFSQSIQKIEDLKKGMNLPAIVKNITNFGVFLDIGIKENALLHISQIYNNFIKDPSEVLYLNQKLIVNIIELDIERKRISVSLK